MVFGWMGVLVKLGLGLDDSWGWEIAGSGVLMGQVIHFRRIFLMKVGNF
jgi:hypothetical protein